MKWGNKGKNLRRRAKREDLVTSRRFQIKSVEFSDLFLADRWRALFIKTSPFIIKVSMVVSSKFKCSRGEVGQLYWGHSRLPHKS